MLGFMSPRPTPACPAPPPPRRTRQTAGAARTAATWGSAARFSY